MQLLTLLKGIFIKSNKEGWTCDFEENFNFEGIDNCWKNCEKFSNANWSKYMKGESPIIYGSNDNNTFARFDCYYNENDKSIRTKGVWTKGTKIFGPGKFEFKVRFNSGKATWPAIWLRNISSNQDPEHWMDDYYEIDIVEYFGNKSYFTHTLHTPESMIKKRKPINNFSLVKKNDWNIFVCEYDEQYIKIYVNDSLVFESYANEKKYPKYWYLILSMQYGYGNIKENIMELPKWMDIQYVKHYIKNKK